MTRRIHLAFHAMQRLHVIMSLVPHLPSHPVLSRSGCLIDESLRGLYLHRCSVVEGSAPGWRMSHVPCARPLVRDYLSAPVSDYFFVPSPRSKRPIDYSSVSSALGPHCNHHRRPRSTFPPRVLRSHHHPRYKIKTRQTVFLTSHLAYPWLVEYPLGVRHSTPIIA